MLVLVQLFGGFVIAMLPISLSKYLIRRKLRINHVSMRFYFSGRVALYRLSLLVRWKYGVESILLPDYICNVLYKSVKKAGLQPISYITNNNFEPCVENIKKLVAKNSSVALCLAPIFGADGGADWIFSEEGKQWRQDSKVILFLDFCQDVHRVKDIDKLGQDFAVFSSYNDKSFPGVMGSMVLTDIDDSDYSKPRVDERIGILKIFILKIIYFMRISEFFKWLNSIIHKKSLAIGGMVTASFVKDNRFEYSWCVSFPYDFNHSGATRLQIGVGTAGILMSNFYLLRKKRYEKRFSFDSPVQPHYLTAPFIILKDNTTISLKNKNPYAIDDNNLISRRSEILAVHFKGFDDAP